MSWLKTSAQPIRRIASAVFLRARVWITQVLIWVTQSLNVWLFAGYADESVSSRCWRLRRFPVWCQLRQAVDWVALTFFGQASHCEQAFEAELWRRQVPPSLRVTK